MVECVASFRIWGFGLVVSFADVVGWFRSMRKIYASAYTSSNIGCRVPNSGRS